MEASFALVGWSPRGLAPGFTSKWCLDLLEGPLSLPGPRCTVAAGIGRQPCLCVFCWLLSLMSAVDKDVTKFFSDWPMMSGPSLLTRPPLGPAPAS